MIAKQTPPWVPLNRIEPFIQAEPALIILGLAASAWIIAKTVLKDLPQERNKTLQIQFKNLSYHFLYSGLLFSLFIALDHLPYKILLIDRILTYIGLLAILSGSTVFVKVWRILVFEYLYLSHMKVAFPVLLVNLFTLLLSILLGSWIGAEIFNIRLTPLLATSAIFSLVLGLALQDTLGNLFAGVALQMDKPYEIGDWIEIQTSGQKWVGQVHDISWRATVLISFTDEASTIPNRIMAQAQISNYSTKYRPIIRSQPFRLPFGVDSAKIKEILSITALSIPKIRKNPAPFVLISETTESWVTYKLVYYLDDFGEQFRVTDQIFTKGLAALESAGFKLANHRVTLTEDCSIPGKKTPII